MQFFSLTQRTSNVSSISPFNREKHTGSFGGVATTTVWDGTGIRMRGYRIYIVHLWYIELSSLLQCDLYRFTLCIHV